MNAPLKNLPTVEFKLNDQSVQAYEGESILKAAQRNGVDIPHLCYTDGLRADGFLDAKLERHGVGRPALVFFATERGEELSGRTYLQLLSRLFRHLEKSDGVYCTGPCRLCEFVKKWAA